MYVNKKRKISCHLVIVFIKFCYFFYIHSNFSFVTSLIMFLRTGKKISKSSPLSVSLEVILNKEKMKLSTAGTSSSSSLPITDMLSSQAIETIDLAGEMILNRAPTLTPTPTSSSLPITNMLSSQAIETIDLTGEMLLNQTPTLTPTPTPTPTSQAVNHRHQQQSNRILHHFLRFVSYIPSVLGMIGGIYTFYNIYNMYFTNKNTSMNEGDMLEVMFLKKKNKFVKLKLVFETK